MVGQPVINGPSMQMQNYSEQPNMVQKTNQAENVQVSAPIDKFNQS